MNTDTGWIGEKVKCDLCSYEWIAVYHSSCDKLECANCGNMASFETVTEESRCCGRCDGINDLCVSDTYCESHNIQGCELCFGKRK